MKKNCKDQSNKVQIWKSNQDIKGDKIYVKWKCYDNLFNNWIDKKRHSIN